MKGHHMVGSNVQRLFVLAAPGLDKPDTLLLRQPKNLTYCLINDGQRTEKLELIVLHG